ncbi:hypothetical protein UVI_02014970 [Ustilaginoidea virens]|uniref:Uncharacterized protein n=1 Tax=Ustilaginoidea virens TaxID=1159556 RepID=A0A1B5L8D6_USTVR|nr:hypothetical protein UVI_02014970 [Ustilaginoidea virens]
MNLRHALVVLGAARTMAADETKPAWRPAGVVALIGIDGDKWWSGCDEDEQPCLVHQASLKAYCRLSSEPYFYWMRPTVEPNE